jgi:hypothetical protein
MMPRRLLLLAGVKARVARLLRRDCILGVLLLRLT